MPNNWIDLIVAGFFFGVGFTVGQIVVNAIRSLVSRG
jgi:hypothetical protein